MSAYEDVIQPWSVLVTENNNFLSSSGTETLSTFMIGKDVFREHLLLVSDYMLILRM